MLMHKVTMLIHKHIYYVITHLLFIIYFNKIMLLNVLAEVNLYERWDGEMGNLIISLSPFFSSVPRPPNKQTNKQNKTLGWPVETLHLFIIVLRKSGIEHVSSLKGSPGHTVQCQDWVQNLERR